MYSITKEFGFEYSHRLTMDYDSACKNVHGHSAKIFIQIWSPELNKNGMIVDFVHLREVQKMLDDLFDHSIILNGKDLDWCKIVEEKNVKHFILNNNIDPTSEVMSRIIWDKVAKYLNDLAINWDSMEVTFFETAKNAASYKSSYKPI